MVNMKKLKLFSLLILLIVFLGVPVSSFADESKEIDLKIEQVDFVSSLKYWGLKISDYVLNYPGKLNITLINKGTQASPKAKLNAEIEYIYSKPGPDPSIYPTGYGKGRLNIGHIDIPSIKPNGFLEQKLETKTISFRKPGVNGSITLKIEIKDLSEDNNVLLEDLSDHILSTDSNAIEKQRSKLYFIISIITLIIVFITLLISLPEKRPVLSVVIIIALSVIAYLIYKSV
jgi:hypothetical protein